MACIAPLRRSPTAFPNMLGGDGEAVREAKDMQPVLRRAQESGTCALIHVWVDPEVCSPGIMRPDDVKKIDT
jgi:thiamine pyrophosphate-dependent acetolactate synthase large subunit-like protein